MLSSERSRDWRVKGLFSGRLQTAGVRLRTPKAFASRRRNYNESLNFCTVFAEVGIFLRQLDDYLPV